MKKKKDIKKLVKKPEKLEESKFNKKQSNSEVDLWKEIKTNLKPLVKAYNKFSEKRKIAKKKEEERNLKENEKQRLKEEEAFKLQEEEEKRLYRQIKIKEQKEKKLLEQEQRKLEEKRIINERDERIRQEQNYRERLIKADEERSKLLARVSESREEERKLRDERTLDMESKFAQKKNSANLEESLKYEEKSLQKDEQRLRDKEKTLINEEKRLQQESQRLKDIEDKLKNDREIILKEKNEVYLDKDPKIKRLNGKVLWFNDAKGYGFIKREDNEKNLFVHFSSVQNSGLTYLKEADQLTFEVESSDKGLSAVNLEKLANDVSLPHLKVIK